MTTIKSRLKLASSLIDYKDKFLENFYWLKLLKIKHHNYDPNHLIKEFQTTLNLSKQNPT